jgi:hypothetical protein
MMWEEYLERAAASIPNKYRARRFKARVRSQLLREYALLVGEGMDRQQALTEATERLGAPEAVMLRLTAPERRQHGWLWTVSVFELLIGLTMMMVSMHSEYFAGMALGRIVTVWGMLATVIHSRHPGKVRQALASFREGARSRWSGVSGPMVLRVAGIGALSGVMGGLFLILPWNLIDSNIIDPVLLSEGSMVAVAIAVAIGPLMVFAAWRNQLLRSVALQVYAGIAASVTYTGLLWWHPGLVPPPFFNWNVPLMVVVGFASYFGCIRLYHFLLAVKEPIDTWESDEILPEAM